MALGKSLLYYGEVHDIAYSAERIREVTPGELRDIARLILDNGLSRLTIL